MSSLRASPAPGSHGPCCRLSSRSPRLRRLRLTRCGGSSAGVPCNALRECRSAYSLLRRFGSAGCSKRNLHSHDRPGDPLTSPQCLPLQRQPRPLRAWEEAELRADRIAYADPIVALSPGRPRGRQIKPHVCQDVILRNTQTLVVHQAELILRTGVAQFAGETKPVRRLDVILRDAIAVGIHQTEIRLRPRVAMPRQGTEYCNSGGIVVATESGHAILRPRRRRTGCKKRKGNDGRYKSTRHPVSPSGLFLQTLSAIPRVLMA